MAIESANAILILEFINAEQFPGQIRSSLPLLKGYANWLGIQGRWIRFGLNSAHFYQHGKDAVTLNDAELASLRGCVETMAQTPPDLVVTTHQLGVEARGLLESLIPDAEVVLLDELEWTRRWPKGPLPMEMDRPGFAPDYGWESGNLAAQRRDRNNVYVLGSVGCGYRKSVHSNPYYAALDLPESLMGGCAFCGARIIPGQMLEALAEGGEACTADIRAWRQLVAGTLRVPSEFINRQIDAVARTLPGSRTPNALLFQDIERPEVLEVAVAALASHPELASVKLLAGIRVDRLLQLEGWLRARFDLTTPDGRHPKLEHEPKSEHEPYSEREAESERENGQAAVPSLQIFSCGLENFSATELQRLNKGTTPLMNLRAVNLLKELELASEGRFFYSGYMGLSVLLFTPWTTLEELHLNIGLLLHLRLENEVGNLFMSRLRLHPDLAITALARHDNVIVDCEDDPALVLNRRKLFEQELPWKHLDPRMDAVSRIAVRLEADERLANDALYRTVQTSLLPESATSQAHSSRGERRRKLVQTLMKVIEAAVEAGEPVQAEDLIARVRRGPVAWSRARAVAGGGKPERWATLLAEDLNHCSPFSPPLRLGLGLAQGTRLPGGSRYMSSRVAESFLRVAQKNEALVVDLDHDQGEVVRIQVESSDEDGLRYSLVAGVEYSGALGQALASGDRLLISSGQVQVRSGDLLRALWTATVGVWHEGFRWHSAEWHELAKAALRNADPRMVAAESEVQENARKWIADPVILGGKADA